MLVTVTEYSKLAIDQQGNKLPIGSAGRLACTALTADDDIELQDGTCFVRIATDTALRVNFAGSLGSGDDELIPAGVEYVAVRGGLTLAIAAVA